MEVTKQIKCKVFCSQDPKKLEDYINDLLQNKSNCSEVEIVDIKFCVTHDQTNGIDWYSAMIIYR